MAGLVEAGSQPTAKAEFGSPTYSANFLVVRRGRLHQHCCLVATGCHFLRALPALLAHIVAPNRYLRIASLTSSCDSVLFRCESRSYKTASAGVHVCHFCPQAGGCLSPRESKLAWCLQIGSEDDVESQEMHRKALDSALRPLHALNPKPARGPAPPLLYNPF